MEEFYDLRFSPENAPKPAWAKGLYEACTFEGIDFSGVNLSGFRLVDCRFVGCQFRGTLLGGTVLNGVDFEDCLLQGIRFPDAAVFGLRLGFAHCILRQCSFAEMSLAGMKAMHNQWVEVDFSATQLVGAQLAHSRWQNCLFGQTNLGKADLRFGEGLVLDIRDNFLKGAMLEQSQLPALLSGFGLRIY